MPLNIKNERAHDLARQLAEQTGESLTTAVVVALEERLTRVKTMKKPANLKARLMRIVKRASARPAQYTGTLEDLLYDENGLPK